MGTQIWIGDNVISAFIDLGISQPLAQFVKSAVWEKLEKERIARGIARGDTDEVADT